jgi:ELWxxDGT repeat protein
LLRDINPGAAGSFPRNLTIAHEMVYFTANEPAHGAELWRTDGTSKGTALVRDIRPGGRSSNPENLIAVGSTLFFSANDGVHGTELWKTDGTPAGTTLVKDVASGAAGSNPLKLTAVNDRVYFVANNRTNGYALWVSDGTAAGTRLVKDLFTDDNLQQSFKLFDSAGTLYFTTSDPTDSAHPDNLWTTDGTEAGTRLLKSINASELVNLNGTTFFRAGGELWKTDGTPNGTVLVKSISPQSNAFPITHLTPLNGNLYFLAEDFADGEPWYNLFRTDGTSQGTVQVTQRLFVGDLVAFDDALFFFNDENLYRSDGTAQGTRIIDERSGRDYAPVLLTPHNGYLYYLNSSGPAREDEPAPVALYRTNSTGDVQWVSDDVLADPVSVNGTLLGAFVSSDKGVEPAAIPFAILQSIDPMPGPLLISGTNGNDVISITRRDDMIRVSRNGEALEFPVARVNLIAVLGLEGNDIIDSSGVTSRARIVGGNGNDVITCGVANDTVSGGAGADRISTGGGDDLISGNAQNDNINAGAGNDRVSGHGGRDKIAGGAGNDQIYGGASGDFLSGQAGTDQLFGDSGNDRIYGGAGDRDTLHGGSGDDILVSNDGTIDDLFGDSGNDTAFVDNDDFLTSVQPIVR